MTAREAKKIIIRQRAKKHLERACDHLCFLYEAYATNERSSNPFKMVDREYYLKEIKDEKERICRLQRIAL